MEAESTKHPGARSSRRSTVRRRRIAERVASDPWSLHRVFQLRWERRLAFLPPRRVLLRALGLAATRAGAGPDLPGGETALERIVDLAVDELLGDQSEEEARGAPFIGTEDEDFYGRVAHGLGLALEHARLACVVLNGQPEAVRRGLLERCFQGRPTGGDGADWTEPGEPRAWRRIRNAIERSAR